VSYYVTVSTLENWLVTEVTRNVDGGYTLHYEVVE
jgi:hypothetical protein